MKKQTTRRAFLRSSAALSAITVGCDVAANNADGPISDVMAGGDAVAHNDTAGMAGDEGGLSDPGMVEPDEGMVEPDEGMVEPDEGMVEPDEGPQPDVCEDPFEGGELLGQMEFLGEGNPLMNQPFGSELDGREYFLLSELTPDNLLTPVESFYIRTRAPSTLDTSGEWKIQIGGLIDDPFELTMADLEPLIEDQGTVLMECSGNGAFAHFGMLSTTTWRGVSFQHILDMVNLKADATMVEIVGFDDHQTPSANSQKGASWVYQLDTIVSYGAFLATHMNGEPLPVDHGFPVRLLVPRWYGCCSAKWLAEIKFVGDTATPTSQMMEFSTRTHQEQPPPSLAKDWKAGTIDQTGMPTRVEQWRVDGEILYKVWGIAWGGYAPLEPGQMEMSVDGQTIPVTICPTPETNDHWHLWWAAWTPQGPGNYDIRMRMNDPVGPTKRLDSGFYERVVQIDE